MYYICYESAYTFWHRRKPYNRKYIKSKTYKGIYAFHKYWGKKTIESLDYCIENCTNKNDIVLDPFLGSGLISKEAHNLGRRFLGIDINPFSIEHTLFLLSLPKTEDYKKAINVIKKTVSAKISESYALENSDVATHFLWHKDTLQEVWTKNNTSRKKIQLKPTEFDLSKIKKFESYSVRNIRKGTFFENSRINSLENMTIYDLFTKRALYNIDLILDEINKFSGNLKRALQLTLTSSSGQMSNMVFAITGRGKTKNQQLEKIEVGSWGIGLWRPDLHFEINVWNCFEWGGDYQNSLDKYLVSHYVKTIQSFDELTSKCDKEIKHAVHGYV